MKGSSKIFDKSKETDEPLLEPKDQFEFSINEEEKRDSSDDDYNRDDLELN